MSQDSKHLSDLIERYAQGTMNPDEKQSFELRLNQDATLYTEVEKQRILHLLIVEEGLNDIRQMIKDDFSKRKTSNKIKWIGAGLVILILLGVFLYYSVYKKELTDIPFQKAITFSVNKQPIIQTEKNNPISKEKKYADTIQNTSVGLTAKKGLQSSEEIESIEIPKQNHSASSSISVNKNQENLYDAQPIAKESNPCSEFNPVYTLKSIPSIVHQNTGIIEVITKESSLKFTLNNSKTSEGYKFEELEAGKYLLSAENLQGCQSKGTEVIVGNTNCIVLEKEKFNLSGEEYYKFPIITEALSEIHIYNKKMEEIRIFNSGSSFESWDGRNKEGQFADTGLYKIELRYSNGERCLFNLTVFN